MLQISLFDIIEPPPEIAIHDTEPNETEREVAIIIITPSGRKSTSKGVILYVMTETDAQKLCSDDRTRGNFHGREWAYAYTGYWQEAFWVDSWQDIPTDRFRKDDGRFDGLMSELGIEPIFARR